jgi:histidinol-phosphate/aromatic aminotransferase/cobyric acid decarboxylase-like protein
MITQNTNFKTISCKTQNYDLFKKILKKSIISRDIISLRKNFDMDVE